METWQTYLDHHRYRFQEDLLDFLRIPSISSLPEHAGDVQRAGEWVASRLRAAGIEGVRILPTGGHPIVYGEWLHAPGKPTVLIYGHFDTQPVDPFAQWANPPFEPVIRDGRVFARGASDDKGNMLIPILAVEALLESDAALPVNLKFFLEGQEEIGSPQIPAFLAANRELFACDLVVSADGGQWSEDRPGLMVGFKGLAGLQIDVHGPQSDLHSGVYGGIVPNPIHALVGLLDSMRSPAGTILVEGFYDAVIPLSDTDRALIAAVPFDEAEYKARLGIDGLVGEPGYTARERNWARPTLEINGIWGGFQGEGVKTVIPGEAHAKITCRLVANQEPEQIVELIAEHAKRHTPQGVRVNIRPLPGTARPYLMPSDHPAQRAAHKVLAQLYNVDPFYVRSGGTLPVCDLFLRTLGAFTVSYGFALDDEQFHAPDEFFRLSSFERGQRAYCELLEELGRIEESLTPRGSAESR
jgi:acetylornithine deacetylase/succinyl-diaminopimelate desuccinylase-like protein